MDPNSQNWQQPDTTQSDTHFVESQPTAPVQPAVSAPVEVAPTSAPEGIDEVIRWSAPEYYTQTKGALWYVGFAVCVLGLIALAIFFFHDYIFATLVAVMAFALFLYTNRPPRDVNYSISRKGIHVGDHLHEFSEFREFGLVSEAKENTISLIPRKRWASSLTFHFPDEAGETIVDMLAARLPMKDIRQDTIDKLLHLLRI